MTALEMLQDLSRRLSSPGATCTQSEIDAVIALLGNDSPAEIPAPPAVAEQVAHLEAEVAALAADVTPVAVPAA